MRISDPSMHLRPSFRSRFPWRIPQANSPQRAGRGQTAVVAVLTSAALALLGLVLAYWAWVWLAPRPVPRAQATVQAADGVGAALGLFGSAQPGPDVTAPTGMAIRLLGIIAATRGSGSYAAVQLEAREILAVREGEDIAPGIRLAEVDTHHVILERNGVRETLALPRQAPAAAPAAPPNP